MKKYTVFIVILIILILLLLLFFSRRDTQQPNSNNSDTNSNLQKPDENYIYCKVDGKEILVTGFPLVTEFDSSGVAVVAASNTTGEYISLTIPLKKTGTFTNIIGNNEADQPKIHYTSKEQVSYENNWVDNQADTSTISVSKYDSVVEGSFSGRLSRIDADGWKTEGVVVTDCEFSIGEFTKM